MCKYKEEMSDAGYQTFIYKRFVETQTLAVQKVRGDTNLGCTKDSWRHEPWYRHDPWHK